MRSSRNTRACRIEQINKQLNTSTKDLALPIRKLDLRRRAQDQSVRSVRRRISRARARRRRTSRLASRLSEEAMTAHDTIPHRILRQAVERPSTIAYQTKINGHWQPTTWHTFADQIRTAARAMSRARLAARWQGVVARFQSPRVGDLRSRGDDGGGCPAGIYTTCSPDEVQYVVHHSESLIILVENADQLAKDQGEASRAPATALDRDDARSGDDRR